MLSAYIRAVLRLRIYFAWQLSSPEYRSPLVATVTIMLTFCFIYVTLVYQHPTYSV